MNAITISRIADLESILDAARQCARRVRLSAESGDMGPDEAAAILSESLATVTAWSNTAPPLVGEVVDLGPQSPRIELSKIKRLIESRRVPA